MAYWLVKQEPEEFSWQDLLTQGKVIWDGVRNYQARNNLKAMALGDLVLFYHSVTEKQVMGIAQVSQAAFPDPSDDTGKWFSVELKPERTFLKPATLGEIKAHPALQNIALVRQPRLSVMPIQPEEFEVITQLGGL